MKGKELAIEILRKSTGNKNTEYEVGKTDETLSDKNRIRQLKRRENEKKAVFLMRVLKINQKNHNLQ